MCVIALAGGEEDAVDDYLLSPAERLEQKRLKQIQRQFDRELQNLENDIIQASFNKLRREATERNGDYDQGVAPVAGGTRARPVTRRYGLRGTTPS